MSTSRILAGVLSGLCACSSGGISQPAEMLDGAPAADEGGMAGDMAPAPDLWLPPAEGKALWAHSYVAGGTAVGAAADGSVLFAGPFARADFGDGMVSAKGLADGFLVKYDRAGKRLWARTFGRDFNDTPQHLAVDPMGTVTVVGYSLRSENTSSHDIFIARYGADGTQKLFKIYGGPQLTKVDAAGGVAAAADGGFYIAGGSEDSLDLGGGVLAPKAPRDVIVAHYSADGSHRWSRRFGSTSYNQAQAALVAADGDLLIAGSGSPGLDFGDGNPTTNTDQVAFLARFSPTGTLRWSRHFPSTSSAATALANGPGGTIWVAGDFGIDIDLGSGPKMDTGKGGIFWGQFDAAGRNLSSFVLSGEGGLTLSGVAVDRHGQLIIGGQADTVVDFGAGPSMKEEGQHFVMKRAADGRLRWVRRFGGTFLDRLADVAVTPDDGVLCAGKELSKAVTLDGVQFQPYGYVLSLSP